MKTGLPNISFLENLHFLVHSSLKRYTSVESTKFSKNGILSQLWKGLNHSAASYSEETFLGTFLTPQAQLGIYFSGISKVVKNVQ